MTNLFEKIKELVDFSQIEESREDRPDKLKCGICGDSDYALTVYPEGNWKCFSCGSKGGDITAYVAERDRLSMFEAAKKLISDFNLDIEIEDLSEEEKKKRKQRKRIRNCQQDVVEKAQDNLSTAKRKQLEKKRGWSKETIQELQIGWMNEELFNNLKERYGELLEEAGIHYGMTGSGDGAYVFPHLKRNGRPYLLTCRDPNPVEDAPKYIQSESSDYVENDIYYATGHNSDTLVLTEGYPDAISAFEAGVDAVAAGCGSFEGNRRRLLQFSKQNGYSKVLIVLDNDETGREELQKIGRTMSNRKNCLIHQWKDEHPEGYDLDDWTTDNSFNLDPLIQDAVSFLDAFRSYKPSKIDASLIRDKVSVRGNIKGQKQGDALPAKLTANCKECGEGYLEIDLSEPQTVERFLTSRSNQHNLITKKLSNHECQACESSNWSYQVTEYIDKSWIQLQDLIEESEEFSATQNNKVPVYILDDKLPSSKSVKVRGTIHVNSQNDQIFVIADEVEPEDDSYQNVDLSQEDHDEYRDRWTKEKAEKMVATDMVGRENSRTALQLTAHSPVRIPTITGEITRGALRTGFFGDGGTYKSKQVKELTKDGHGLGGFFNAENGGRTGLTYTIDNDKRVIEWGALVLNDKGLVGIDGLNELHGEDLTQMREVMEDLQVEVNRSVQGSAPARTRIIGCWNPPKQLIKYKNPAEALQKMGQFSGPDYRRWDLLIPFDKGDVSKEDIHYRDQKEKPYSEDFYRKHVKWAWSLTPDDIVFGSEFETELKTQSYNIANAFEYSQLPIVSGAFREKLTRLTVSWAVLKHSVTEDGRVLVKAEHVSEVKEFFSEVMEDLGIKDAQEDYEERTTLDEEEAKELKKELDEDQLEILEVVYDENPISAADIGAEVDLSKRTVKEKWTDLKSENLLRVKSGQGATTTSRTIQFMDLVHEVHVCTNDSEEGGGGSKEESSPESEESTSNQGNTPPTPAQNLRENVKNVKQEEEFLRILEDNNGKLHYSEAKELGYDVDQLENLALESDKIGKGFGAPEGSSDVENRFELEKAVQVDK